MENFSFAFNSCASIILFLAVGYIFRTLKLFTTGFFRDLNRFVFRVAIPVLLFYNIYNTESVKDIRWPVIIYGCVMLTVLFFAGLAIAALFVKDPCRKGVIAQCCCRSNVAVLGLPLAQALAGEEGVLIISLLTAFSIPLINIMSVIALSCFMEQPPGRKRFNYVLREILHNPLIWGVAAGLLSLALRSFIPKGSGAMPLFSLKNSLPNLWTVIKGLAEMASPIGLISLGGQFSFSSVRTRRNNIILGVFLRLIFAPLLCISLAVILEKINIFSFNAADYCAFIALFATPVSISSTVMASAMNNDGELAGQLLVWTSSLSVLSLFFIILIMKALGFI